VAVNRVRHGGLRDTKKVGYRILSTTRTTERKRPHGRLRTGRGSESKNSTRRTGRKMKQAVLIDRICGEGASPGEKRTRNFCPAESKLENWTEKAPFYQRWIIAKREPSFFAF